MSSSLSQLWWKNVVRFFCFRVSFAAFAWFLVPGPCSALAGAGIGTERIAASGTPSKAQARHSPRPSLLDLMGHRVDPFAAGAAKAYVFLFIDVDCPIANRYAPEIRRLHERFSSAHVQFCLVYADPATSSAAIREHVKAFQLPGRALRDPAHEMVRISHVHVTPEAAVFLSNRQLVYHGRIDDRFVDFGKERQAPTQRDLEQTLDAVVAGKTVLLSWTRAVGCSIPTTK